MNLFSDAIEQYKNKNYENAIQLFKQIENPSFDVCKNLGILYTFVKQSPVYYYEKALRLKYDEKIAMVLCDNYKINKQYHLLYGLCHTILFLNPTHKDALTHIGDLNCHICNHSVAREYYGKAGFIDDLLPYYEADWMNMKKTEPNPTIKTTIKRIGYIATCFTNKKHPINCFMNYILKHHSDRFSVYCYQLSDVAGDFCFSDYNITYKEFVNESCDIVAKYIKNDEIDILVDLMQLTSDYLSIFNYNPAPIQVSYCAFPGTTNNPNIHYKIMDLVSFNQKTDYYSEKILCMSNGFHAYSPLTPNPIVKHVKSDHIRLCCFNNPIKLTKEIIACWILILEKLPKSHLYLAYHYYSSNFLTTRLKSYFNNDRVHFIGFLERDERMSLYNKMDIALDTYPYNGTTITCEALSMNVPVVTLMGEFPHTRIGGSLVSTIQCHELIAGSYEKYITKVLELSTDIVKIKNKIETNIHMLTKPKQFIQEYEFLLTSL